MAPQDGSSETRHAMAVLVAEGMYRACLLLIVALSTISFAKVMPVEVPSKVS